MGQNDSTVLPGPVACRDLFCTKAPPAKSGRGFWVPIGWDVMADSGNYSDQEKALEYVKSLIRPFPDFPTPGIVFR